MHDTRTIISLYIYTFISLFIYGQREISATSIYASKILYRFEICKTAVSVKQLAVLITLSLFLLFNTRIITQARAIVFRIVQR